MPRLLRVGGPGDGECRGRPPGAHVAAGVATTAPASLARNLAPADAPRLPRGTLLDRYVVLDWIGSGGMGAVYSAYDSELDRKLAIKLLLPGHGGVAGSAGRVRLMREAQAIARLSHRNVIGVYDVGTIGDQVFFGMEFVDGAPGDTLVRIWYCRTTGTW